MPSRIFAHTKERKNKNMIAKQQIDDGINIFIYLIHCFTYYIWKTSSIHFYCIIDGTSKPKAGKESNSSAEDTETDRDHAHVRQINNNG